MQHGGIESRADDRRVGLALAAGHFVDFLHARGHLIFEQSGTQMRIASKCASIEASMAFCISASSPGDFTMAQRVEQWRRVFQHRHAARRRE